MPASPLAALGRFAVRRKGWILLFGLIFTVLAGGLGAGAMNALSLSRIDAPGSESDQAKAILETRFQTGPPNLLLLVTANRGTIDDPAVRAAGTAITDSLRAQAGVAETASYWSRNDSPALRGRDGRQAIVLARVAGDVNAARARVGELSPTLSRDDDLVRVQVGGQDEAFRQVAAQARQDFLGAEMIALPLVLLLLMLVFRRVRVALLTLGVGIFAVVTTLAVLRGFTTFTTVSTFAANLTLVMGLALGVDYCLFLVSRYREELTAGRTVENAVIIAVSTAGRTVLFSGLTVAASMCALLIFPLTFMRSFAYAGVFVVLSSLVGALVILPAALAALGHKAASRRVPPVRAEMGLWFRLAHAVMRRPVVTGGLTLVLIGLLCAPALGVRFGVPDDRVLPADASSRITSDAVRAGFDQEETDTLFVVSTSGAAEPSRVDEYAHRLSMMDGVAQVDAGTGSYIRGTLVRPPNARFTSGDSTFVAVIPDEQALNSDITALVSQVRHTEAPFGKVVGGSPAEMSDWRSGVTDYAPLALGVIVLLTLTLLFLMTGSLLLPIKATVLNLLSLGVMFGVLVWIFQDGNFAAVLGFTPTGELETSMPVLMFCIAYGLSMDYEVFITSRIREEYDLTGDNTRAVASGVQRSAPLVTTAAGILALSFLTYTGGGVLYLKMIGLGMAVAVIVDATIIRAILLPAFMRLAGRANWWAPAGLRKLHDRFGMKEVGHPPEPRTAGHAAGTPNRLPAP